MAALSLRLDMRMKRQWAGGVRQACVGCCAVVGCVNGGGARSGLVIGCGRKCCSGYRTEVCALCPVKAAWVQSRWRVVEQLVGAA